MCSSHWMGSRWAMVLALCWHESARGAFRNTRSVCMFFFTMPLFFLIEVSVIEYDDDITVFPFYEHATSVPSWPVLGPTLQAIRGQIGTWRAKNSESASLTSLLIRWTCPCLVERRRAKVRRRCVGFESCRRRVAGQARHTISSPLLQIWFIHKSWPFPWQRDMSPERLVNH